MHPRAMVWLLVLLACGGEAPSTNTPPLTADVATPYPLDAATTAGAPVTYKGLSLQLVQRASPVVTPVDGIIGVVCIGMSNANQECARLIAATEAGGPWAAEKAATVRLVNCAVGNHAIERWIDPAYDATLWDACAGPKLAARGVRRDQVRVILHKAANQFGSGPNGAPLPAYPAPDANYFDFLANLAAFAARVRAEFPAVQAVYTSSRSYGGFSGNAARGEPRSYEEGHALNTWLATHPQVDGIWQGWWGYLWAPACTTGQHNGSGVCYDRADFVEDGVHPSASGEIKIARIQHDRLRQERWYRP